MWMGVGCSFFFLFVSVSSMLRCWECLRLMNVMCEVRCMLFSFCWN